jgi:hypothetical protein
MNEKADYIKKDLEKVSNFINRRYGNNDVKRAFTRIKDFIDDIPKNNKEIKLEDFLEGKSV